jgi:AcrR family transcriptional regulator
MPPADRTPPSIDRARPRARGDKRPLRLDAIVDEALRIIDTEGTDAVSMRKVAAAFDTGPASLYAHVDNKDDLLQLALRKVLDTMPLPEGDTWQAMFRAHAHTIRAVLTAHKDLARLTFGTVPESDRVTEGSERLLSSMIAGGVPPQVAAWSLDVISLYIAADVHEGWLMGRLFDDGSGRPPEEVGMEYFQGFGERMAALPKDRFPTLTTHIDELMNGDGDQRFSFGIEMFIAGMAAQIPSA